MLRHTTPKNSAPRNAPGRICSAVLPSPTRDPPVNEQATDNKMAPLASSPAILAEAKTPPYARAPVSTLPSPLRAFAAPAGFSFSARPARCSSRSTPAKSHRTIPPRRKSFVGWKTSLPAPSPSNAVDSRLPPATAPLPGTTTRTSPHFHPTTAAVRPIQSCRSRPSPHSDKAKTRHPTHTARAHPESQPHILEPATSQTCSTPLAHPLSRMESGTQGQGIALPDWEAIHWRAEPRHPASARPHSSTPLATPQLGPFPPQIRKAKLHTKSAVPVQPV